MTDFRRGIILSLSEEMILGLLLLEELGIQLFGLVDALRGLCFPSGDIDTDTVEVGDIVLALVLIFWFFDLTDPPRTVSLE